MEKIFIILSLLILLIPAFASAQLIPTRIVPECNHPGQPAGACNLCDFFLLIKNIFDFIAKVLVPSVGGFIFLIAGFLLLTSGGSEQRLGQARKLFLGVVIGATIVYVAWIGVGVLLNTIGRGIDGWTPQDWNSFTCNSPS